MTSNTKAYRASIFHLLDDPRYKKQAHEFIDDGLLVVCDGKVVSVGPAAAALAALGEICGREGSQACEHHIKIIKEWGDIPDVSALRRFLGTFN